MTHPYNINPLNADKIQNKTNILVFFILLSSRSLTLSIHPFNLTHSHSFFNSFFADAHKKLIYLFKFC